MKKISKTTVTFTCLHETDTDEALHAGTGIAQAGLEALLQETDTGDACGWETGRVTEPVPADQVEAELLALGNDGKFFSYGEDEDEDDDDDR